MAAAVQCRCAHACVSPVWVGCVRVGGVTLTVVPPSPLLPVAAAPTAESPLHPLPVYTAVCPHSLHSTCCPTDTVMLLPHTTCRPTDTVMPLQYGEADVQGRDFSGQASRKRRAQCSTAVLPVLPVVPRINTQQPSCPAANCPRLLLSLLAPIPAARCTRRTCAAQTSRLLTAARPTSGAATCRVHT